MEDAVYQEFLELERTHWWFRGRRRSSSPCSIATSGARRTAAADPRRGLRRGACWGRWPSTGASSARTSRSRGCSTARRGTSRGWWPATARRSCFRDDSLDCITAFDALEHIDDDTGTLRDIHRMLKPGGLLVASGPAYQFLFAQQDRVTHHVRRYTLGDFTRKARAAGLRIEQASYINFLLFPAILPAVLALKAGSTAWPIRPTRARAATWASASRTSRTRRWRGSSASRRGCCAT
jgi:SAM-dependent methyltransferase